jgi:hypothetical protein
MCVCPFPEHVYFIGVMKLFREICVLLDLRGMVRAFLRWGAGEGIVDDWLVS